MAVSVAAPAARSTTASTGTVEALGPPPELESSGEGRTTLSIGSGSCGDGGGGWEVGDISRDIDGVPP